eukprot:TRINITY_DN26764_c0_g1_i1.p1 TRINITY_DN26764_c0_g1~~TRINITY_DN26764_c0_g1_i1.p1  ORF type:complete len:146 (-),score=38.38 TRINITY_DN26764_c0_g1_i1:53-490(-)
MARFSAALLCMLQLASAELSTLQRSYSVAKGGVEPQQSQSATCNESAEEKLKDSIALRTRYLQSRAASQEKKLGSLHLELMGEARASSARDSEPNLLAVMQALEGGMQERGAAIEALLTATEAAIERKKGQLQETCATSTGQCSC